MLAYIAQSHNGSRDGIRGAQDLHQSFDLSRHLLQAAAAKQRSELAQSGAAGSEEFWIKLEEMKLKYKGPMGERSSGSRLQGSKGEESSDRAENVRGIRTGGG